MKSSEYWEAILIRNPKMAEKDTVTIKVESIRAMVEQAHQKGMEHQVSSTHNNPFNEDSFGGFFGGRRK